MKNIISIVLWISCIGLLSFAYEGFLSEEFRFQQSQGFITEKGTETLVSNQYGNYQSEKRYWVLFLNEKIEVNKQAYNSLHVNDEVIVNRTKHGIAIEKL